MPLSPGCCCRPLINKVAFPAPEHPLSYYQSNILSHPDLVWLKLKQRTLTGRERFKNGECIPAIFVSSGAANSKYTILFSHGNAEDLSSAFQTAQILAKSTSCNVLVYDYPGYSLNRFLSKPNFCSKASEEGCKLAIEAAFRYLIMNQNIHSSKIIIMGVSIGSGPSTYLASRKKIPFLDKDILTNNNPQNAGGIFLQSPIESAFRVALKPLKKTLCCLSTCCGCYDMFQNYKKIKSVSIPFALLHGTEDDVVHVSNGKTLFKNYKDKLPDSEKEFLIDPLYVTAGHNDIDPTDTISQLLNLIAMVTKKQKRNGIEASRQSHNQTPESLSKFNSENLSNQPILTEEPVKQKEVETGKAINPGASKKKLTKEELRAKRARVQAERRKQELS
eukprot:maker-scaffold_19-snap-gene-5.56-mRNA-1 protein AED:0.00 eAED:0.00 QI:140/1/1/1/1/1/2/135/389